MAEILIVPPPWPASLPDVSVAQAPAIRSVLAATTDWGAIEAWIKAYGGSPRTQANYQRDAYRFLLWARSIGKSFAAVTFEDTLAFRQFLANPGEEWISPAKFPRTDPRWRPFSGPLSPVSVRQSEIAISTMYAWLVKAGYLQGNPFSLSQTRMARGTPRLTRFLSRRDIVHIRNMIAELPEKTPRERANKARDRWIIALFFLTGLRINEAVSARMADVFPRAGHDGKLRWWLAVVGKGNKLKNQPLTSELMTELRFYRATMGLSAEPAKGEVWPLIMRAGLKGRERPLDRTSLHVAIKGMVESTKAYLQAKGDPHAEEFADASAHWLRHSMGSSLADHTNIKNVRDLLRHESLQTTSLYVHSEEDALHDELERVHRLPDGGSGNGA